MKAKKLPSGNYRVQVVAGYDLNGKRIVKSFTAEEEWKALKMATDYINNNGMSVDDKNLTLQMAMSRYIESRKNIIEETTVSAYKQVLNHRFKMLMNMKLTELKPIFIQQALNYEAQNVSAKTIKNSYALLKSVLKMYGADVDLRNIVLPKLVKRKRELPSFETLYPLFKGTSVELPVLLASWLSLRIGEVIGLQFRDIDKKKRTIELKRSIIKTDDGYKVREGLKTEKSQRVLALPDYIYNLIEQQPHEKETDFIVPLTRKIVYGRFKKIVLQNGIDMTFHDLRHLNASIMLMLGVPDKYAMERGGWSTDNILKSVYQETFSSERKRVDKMVDGYFNEIIRDSDESA